MLYKKNKKAKLEMDLFRNPTSEYRGTPFWAWNSVLEKKELEWQMEIFKKMGFGGAHLHVRTGMATEYLSDEHMELVKACVEKAKKEDMLVWLYDEDRWPSGPAGGIVTKDERFRGRYLLFTPHPYGSEDAVFVKYNSMNAKVGRSEQGQLLACYDVELDEEGYLRSYHMIGEHEEAKYDKWYAYLETLAETTWWNGQTYVNTLDKAAIDRFIEVTYESYNRTVSEEFGETIPSIFTDEPQFVWKGTLRYATEKADVGLPWADDLQQSFARAYEGADLLAKVPELIWDLANGEISVARYRYHDHVCQRFTEAFADNCGAWCKEHGIALTGHVMKEPTLYSQTLALGEAMRAYRSFGIPGMDMLCRRFEYTTAKQVQSAVHQFDREAMLSELYGVTNWDFDFRGHKLHGDWQAALGVTVRVPHLSYLSMEGEAKRDYPASIHYQSPWWEKYSLVEDHFARVATAMSRGKAVVKVGVIHPIESYWLHWGPEESTALERENRDENFQNITKWLLFGGIDFDFISESLLPELCDKATAPLKVGAMEYDVILVPGCQTLRSTTLERLEDFANAGGNLIFAGEIPELEGAVPSLRGKNLAEKATCVQFNRGAVLKALEPNRLVEMRDQSGALTNNLLYQLRQDGDGLWLFVAHGKEPYNMYVSNYQELRIRIKGMWKATIYNTMNGETEEICQSVKGNLTELNCRMYDFDSLLVRLEPLSEPFNGCDTKEKHKEMAETKIPVPLTVPYTLTEPNVLLLDRAEYALDDGAWNEEEELLRADVACRRHLGWNTDIANVAQPWTLKEDPKQHRVRLRWHIQSEIAYEGASLAIEQSEKVSLKWNGKEISNQSTGWFTDKSIRTIPLPNIEIGENILEAEVPISTRITVEWAYLLGDFGVEVVGKNTKIIARKKELAFGDITTQGLPFYSGNIIYHMPITTGKGELQICCSQYYGALLEVHVDDGEQIANIYPPYVAKLGPLEEGEHVVHITYYGSRINAFGPVHLADEKKTYVSPEVWRTEGDSWCYEYQLRKLGILVTPILTLLCEKD